jgi:hypothetical protein
MFEWRFRFTPGIIPQPFLETAYYAGWGRIPRMTLTTIENDNLVLRTDSLCSGTVHLPMVCSPLGVVMESTESLLSRQEPYFLTKELARGSLGRFYRRLFDWQMLGFRQPDELENRVKRLAQRFSKIVGTPFSQKDEQEFMSIMKEIILVQIDENKEFAEQSLSWRTRNDDRLPIVFGIGMNARHFATMHEFGTYAEFLQNSFHAVMPMPTWRELEPEPGKFNWERLEKQWAIPSRFGFQIVFGPLLSFCTDTFPEWILPHLSEDGYFESRATRFVNAMVERYGYLAQSWILANRFADQSLAEMPPPRSIAMIRILAQQLRSRGVEVPLIVGISQPWGEYALQRIPQWEQVQIAEALMCCREIDAFLLEMDYGYGNNLTLPRDPMSVGNMIDQWSFLGKKVYISLSVPSAGCPILTAPEIQWTEETQKNWTEALLLTFLSKRSVRGIFWSCLQDPVVPSDSSSGFNYGLINAQQSLKSAFKHFSAARKNLLQ